MTHAPAILVRCDGSAELGLGHVVRCLALADELRDRHGCAVTFAMRYGPLGVEMVGAAGYPVMQPRPDEDFGYRAWLLDSIAAGDAEALVLDVRDELGRDDVGRVAAAAGVVVAAIDDVSQRRLAADVDFLPPVPQVRRLSWADARGVARVGWEWVPLRREFSEPATTAQSQGIPTVLVTMGGSDPLGLTSYVIQELDALDGDFEVVVVLGPGFLHEEALATALLKSLRTYDLRRGADVRALMVRATVAVAAFGVTAYELAATGVPAVYLCLTPDHAESASAFVDEGIAVSLGVADEVGPGRIAAAVEVILRDDLGRKRMSNRARALVDGRGASRIADEIVARTSDSTLSCVRT